MAYMLGEDRPTAKQGRSMRQNGAGVAFVQGDDVLGHDAETTKAGGLRSFVALYIVTGAVPCA